MTPLPAWLLVLGAAGPLTGLLFALQCGAALALYSTALRTTPIPTANATASATANANATVNASTPSPSPSPSPRARAWILISAAAAWRLWGRHYFYATGHHNNFNKLQYSAAFVGFDEFEVKMLKQILKMLKTNIYYFHNKAVLWLCRIKQRLVNALLLFEVQL